LASSTSSPTRPEPQPTSRTRGPADSSTVATARSRRRISPGLSSRISGRSSSYRSSNSRAFLRKRLRTCSWAAAGLRVESGAACEPGMRLTIGDECESLGDGAQDFLCAEPRYVSLERPGGRLDPRRGRGAAVEQRPKTLRIKLVRMQVQTGHWAGPPQTLQDDCAGEHCPVRGPADRNPC